MQKILPVNKMGEDEERRIEHQVAGESVSMLFARSVSLLIVDHSQFELSWPPMLRNRPTENNENICIGNGTHRITGFLRVEQLT